MKYVFILTWLFCFIAIAHTQAGNYTAIIADKKSGAPIAYASIGIVGKDIGTTTSDKGSFTLLLDDANTRDTLVISMIGYEQYQVLTGDFMKAVPGHVIALQPKANQMSEVMVKSRNYRHRRLGNTISSKAWTVAVGTNVKGGYEIGTLMKIKHSPTFIDSVQINVAECTYDSIFYRLNVYEVDNGQLTNILNEPVYINASREQFARNFVVGLLPHNIIVHKNFVVTLEAVKDLGKGSVSFCAGRSDDVSYTRTASQYSWKALPLSAAISAYVTY